MTVSVRRRAAGSAAQVLTLLPVKRPRQGREGRLAVRRNRIRGRARPRPPVLRRFTKRPSKRKGVPARICRRGPPVAFYAALAVSRRSPAIRTRRPLRYRRPTRRGLIRLGGPPTALRAGERTPSISAARLRPLSVKAAIGTFPRRRPGRALAFHRNAVVGCVAFNG